jgi:type I restriction enzyme, S subunit
MKSDWQKIKLGDILTLQSGYAFSSKRFTQEDGLPLIRIRDIKNGLNTQVNYNGAFEPKYLVKKGDLLIGMDGEFRCYEWKGQQALLNQRVCKLIDFKGIHPKFLLYGINKYLKEIEDVTTFTTVKHISAKKIKDIEFPLPSEIVQKKIVSKLDQAFEAIDQAIANTQKNIENVEELFQNTRHKILSETKEYWKILPLRDVCLVERGSSPRPIKKFLTDDDDGVNWIKIGDTKNVNKYIFHTNQKITKEGAGKSRRVESGDFILSNSMSYGKPYIMKTTGYIHDGWFKLKLLEFIDSEYLYHLLSSKNVEEQFHRLANGSVVKNISGDLVKKVLLPIPPKEEQLKITVELDTLEKHINELKSKYSKKLNYLNELKMSILERAFKGELV